MGRLRLLASTSHQLPCSLWTVPVSSTCLALMRLAIRESGDEQIRADMLCSLANIIAYHFFDMTYEGDYMTFVGDDVPLSRQEVAEMQAALQQIRAWVVRDEEEWMRETLARIVAGEMSYDDLPRTMPVLC